MFVEVGEVNDETALVDSVPAKPHDCGVMKTARAGRNGQAKATRAKARRLRMTGRLAEKRAVGDANAPKFDGVLFLHTLKK